MKKTHLTIAVAVLTVFALAGPSGAERLTPEDVLATKYAASAVVSPDGRYVAYTVSVPRDIDDDAGPRYSELHVYDIRAGESRPFITGKVDIALVAWRPDGKLISFRTRRGEKAKRQVWGIPIDGGEARQLTNAKDTNVIVYEWMPDGEHVIYTATPAQTKREKELKKRGYGFTYVEENLKHRNLYMENVADDDDAVQTLIDDHTVWTIEPSPNGRMVAFGGSKRNLIDERYAFQRIYLHEIETGKTYRFSDNEGKLGNFRWSPNGDKIVYTAALSRSDHAVSQVYVRAIGGSEARNLTEPDFRGHVEWASWKDNNTIVYRASEGVWTTLSQVKASGGKRRLMFNSGNEGYSFPRITHSPGFQHMAFTASAPDMPSDVYYWTGKGKPKRLTTLNPWLDQKDLGRCEVITYKARDGADVEGLLWYPVGYERGKRYPLMVAVHGGPESHHSYSWRTSYSRPVEVMTGEGYAVFLPNYRSSTGYGLEYTAAHMNDAAGVEFDDVADGIRHLIDVGLADPERVGLSGGSYGGFAAAWFATYYTDLVKATVMFVGISNLISKRGTTDIPYEELYVHSGEKLEDMWQKSLERSPIYYAHQSNTATLIIGGENDTRVHPSQSLELFRRMKMNGHPAVRLVQYPGEGHGNRKMPGRRDVLYRTVQWYNWFVRDLKPLDGGMPDVDISDLYPMKLPEKQEKQKKDTALP